MPTPLDVRIMNAASKIKDAIELGYSADAIAEAAKIVAEMAGATAVGLSFRSASALNGLGKAISEWRLGKAVSGKAPKGVRDI